jgi:hypothetical protein
MQSRAPASKKKKRAARRFGFPPVVIAQVQFHPLSPSHHRRHPVPKRGDVKGSRAGSSMVWERLCAGPHIADRSLDSSFSAFSFLFPFGKRYYHCCFIGSFLKLTYVFFDINLGSYFGCSKYTQSLSLNVFKVQTIFLKNDKP